jgi:ferredoxin
MTDIEKTRESFRITLHTPSGQHVIMAGKEQHIWDAAQMAGVSLPAICHQGRCLTCAGQLMAPGEVDQGDAECYFPQDRQARFVLLCTAKPRSDLLIQTHKENAMRTHRLSCGLPAPYA